MRRPATRLLFDAICVLVAVAALVALAVVVMREPANSASTPGEHYAASTPHFGFALSPSLLARNTDPAKQVEPESLTYSLGRRMLFVTVTTMPHSQERAPFQSMIFSYRIPSTVGRVPYTVQGTPAVIFQAKTSYRQGFMAVFRYGHSLYNVGLNAPLTDQPEAVLAQLEHVLDTMNLHPAAQNVPEMVSPECVQKHIKCPANYSRSVQPSSTSSK
jgi:hypothetical protein